MYYFGAWGSPGHSLFDKTGASAWQEKSKFPVSLYRKLDGGYAPADTDKEGIANLTFVGGYTILAFWDRSFDKRGGSNSAFLQEGMHTFDEMVTQAKKDFSVVWARFPFQVRLSD